MNDSKTMSKMIHKPLGWIRIVNILVPMTCSNNSVKHYLSAFTSEYVKTPADIAKNEMNPTNINSIYPTPIVVLVFTNSW